MIIIVIILIAPGALLNFIYVYTVNSSDSTVYDLNLLEFFISVGKSFLYYLYVPYVYDYLFNKFYETKYSYMKRYSIGIMTVLHVFGLVVVPLLSITFVMDTCLLYAISERPTLVSQSSGNYCNAASIQGYGYCVPSQTFVTEVSYTPPFQYSYICSSSLIVTYIPLYTVMANISTTVTLIFCLAFIIRKSFIYKYKNVKQLFALIKFFTPNKLLFVFCCDEGDPDDKVEDDCTLVAATIRQLRSWFSNFITYTLLAITIGMTSLLLFYHHHHHYYYNRYILSRTTNSSHLLYPSRVGMCCHTICSHWLYSIISR